MGCGKDYIAKNYIIPYIENISNHCFQLSFADQIKVNVMTKNDIPYEEVFVEKTNATRTLLQQEGTEHGREVHGQDIWIKYFDNWMQIFNKRGISNVIVCDVRFENELKYIKSKGGIVIKVIAQDRNMARLISESKSDEKVLEKLRSHKSECDLDKVSDACYDFIVDNSIGAVLNLDPVYKLLFKKIFSESMHTK
jgi:hypothetical protein